MTKATALAIAAGAAYGVTQWPRMTSWGATRQEAEDALPGDEVVGEAKYRTTRAVTIGAPVDEVWPWLAQLGQGRGGLYSYDWLENAVGLHIHSAEEIIPELQDLSVGDVIRLMPVGTEPELHFVVARVEPPHLLVLGPEGTREDAFAANLPYPVWTFRLKAVGDRGTRLVVRFQSDFKPTPLGRLMYKYALEPVHFVMERKMLLTIKERAEGAASTVP